MAKVDNVTNKLIQKYKKREYKHRYNIKHRDKIREYNRKYRQEHPDYWKSARIREYKHKYYLNSKKLGSISTEILSKSRNNSVKFIRRLHKEAEWIRNYSKNKVKDKDKLDDFTERDWYLLHNYYSEDYNSIESDQNGDVNE